MQITLVPTPTSEPVYLVLDDFGQLGRVWFETAETEANESTIIEDIITGQYERPVRVVAFNTDEGWSRDVSQEIAAKLLDLHDQGRLLGEAARDFVERVTGRTVSVVV
jgi:hypothetical protein